jgi:hypothetical protein
MFNCAFCNYSTKRKYDLNRHHNAKHIDKNTKCENEEKLLQNEEKLLQKTEKLLQNEEKLLQSNDITPFQCKKCNKKYKTQTFFINHEKTCKGIDSLTCPKCMKSFSNNVNKNKHIKKNRCKAKTILNLYNNHENNNLPPSLYINGNNNNNNTTNNNIINNIINNFGCERTDYITFDDMIKILTCGDFVIPQYIQMKHFNKDFPENHNIKYEKYKGCLIKKDNRWNITDLNNLADNLLNQNSHELNSFYNNKKTVIEQKIMNIELLQYIYSKFNYLDLSINKKSFNNIKNEIKNIIKTNVLF